MLIFAANKVKKMDVKNNILETIGNTPLIRLNKITKELPCEVFAKVEYFNPGNSIKDRMAVKMVEVAEAEGKLKPGGTIIYVRSRPRRATTYRKIPQARGRW